MPKRYCGRVTIEMREDDRPGWSCTTCFFSIRSSDGKGRARSVTFNCQNIPEKKTPEVFDKLAEDACKQLLKRNGFQYLEELFERKDYSVLDIRRKL